jgi:hypothetical protein
METSIRLFPLGTHTIRHVLRATLCGLLVFSAKKSMADALISSPALPPVPSVAAVYRPGTTLNINGSANGANFQWFRVEWARGINPGSGWSNTGIILTAGGVGRVTNSLLAAWNSGVVTQADFYSIRLLEAETSITNTVSTYVYLEPDLYSTNWPRWLDQAAGFMSVVPARGSSGQTRLAIVNPIWMSTTLPSRLWLWQVDGSSFTTNVLSYGGGTQPAVADLGGTVGDEILVAEGLALRVFNPDGSSYALTPTRSSNFQSSLVTLADLDGDGQLEIIALGTDQMNSTAWLYAWRTNGLMFSTNYPVQIPDANSDLRAQECNRVIPLDVNADGKPELLVVGGDSSSSFSLRMLQADGAPANWQTKVVNGTFEQLIAGDLDNDGLAEFVLAYCNSGYTNLVQVYSSDGSPRAGWPVQLGDALPVGMLLADLNRDGINEIVVREYDDLYVFRPNGSNYPGAWPILGDGFRVFSMPVVGDIDGDGLPEIVAERDGTVYGSPNYKDVNLVAYRGNGTVARSWRLLGANGNQPIADGTPLIGDFDDDGNVDLAVNYRVISGGGTSGYLHEGVMTVLRLSAPFRPDHRDWPVSFHDTRNSAVGFMAAKLRLARSSGNLMLSWPLQPDAAALQFTDELQTTSWNPLATPIVLSNGLNTSAIQATNVHRWYRLQYP